MCSVDLINGANIFIVKGFKYNFVSYDCDKQIPFHLYMFEFSSIFISLIHNTLMTILVVQYTINK